MELQLSLKSKWHNITREWQSSFLSDSGEQVAEEGFLQEISQGWPDIATKMLGSPPALHPFSRCLLSTYYVTDSVLYIVIGYIPQGNTHVLAHMEFKLSYIGILCFQAQDFCLDVQDTAPLDGLDPVVYRETSSEGAGGARKEEALSGNTCQFQWCKYSHCRWFQAANGLTTGSKNSQILNHWFSKAAVSQLWHTPGDQSVSLFDLAKTWQHFQCTPSAP